MSNASDADGEEAGDERRSPKQPKMSHSHDEHEHTYRSEQRGMKRKIEFESSTPKRVDSSESEADSAANGPPSKRQRPSPQIPSNRRILSPYAHTSPFSKSYTGAPLKATPSAENPFAMTPVHQPFGSPKIATSAQNNFTQRSPISANESTLIPNNSQLVAQRSPISAKELTLIPDNTQLVAINSTPSTPPFSQNLDVQEPNTKSGHGVSIDTIQKRSATSRFFSFGQSPAASTLESIETTQSIKSFPPEESKNIHLSKLSTRKSSAAQEAAQSARAADQTSKQEIAMEESPATTVNPLPTQESSSSISNAILPFTLHVENRLPPKPASSRRQIPTLSRPATPYINNTNNTTDFEDSIVMSDEDDDFDIQAAKEKNRIWKQDLYKVRALERETKLAKEKISRGERLGPEFSKQKSSSHEASLYSTYQCLHSLTTVQISRKPSASRNSSRNSMTISSQPVLVFPALGSKMKIEITNTQFIGFLRAVHDQVAVSYTPNTLPDPEEVATLLLDYKSEQLSKATTSIGQKTGNQHINGGSVSMAKTRYESDSDNDSEEELSGEGGDDEDELTSISNRGEHREVIAVPATPAPKSGGWFSTLKSGVKTLIATPFTFKGTSAADAPGPEFTFSREHNIENTQTTPTRTTRPKRYAHSDRRNGKKPTHPTAPQTERKPRKLKALSSHVDPFIDPEWSHTHHEIGSKVDDEYAVKSVVPEVKDAAYWREREEQGQKAHEEYRARSLAWAREAREAKEAFEKSTSNARAQSRNERNIEVEEEVHDSGPGRSYGLPDDFSDEETDDEPSVSEIQEHFTQSPPPKPRPSNAQLPVPAPAHPALAQVNKYIPKKPSGLRNVTAMSPLQKDAEKDDDPANWPSYIQKAVDEVMEKEKENQPPAPKIQKSLGIEGETDPGVIALYDPRIQAAADKVISEW